MIRSLTSYDYIPYNISWKICLSWTYVYIFAHNYKRKIWQFVKFLLQNKHNLGGNRIFLWCWDILLQNKCIILSRNQISLYAIIYVIKSETNVMVNELIILNYCASTSGMKEVFIRNFSDNAISETLFALMWNQNKKLLIYGQIH